MVDLVRKDEAMRRLGVKRSSFAKLIATGGLSPGVVVIGKVRAWRSDELDRFIESRPAAPLSGEYDPDNFTQEG